MNELFAWLGLLPWKAVVGALLLPPVPCLVLVVLAWRWHDRRPLLALLTLSTALTALWLSHCEAVGVWLERRLQIHPVITASELPEFKRQLANRKAAIVVLGGGTLPYSAEYGESHLPDRAYQRLHYGLWLARQLQQPVMVSGGEGFIKSGALPEAQIAARLAARDFGRPVRWIEDNSRDTRDNARLSLPMLRADQISDVVLVTHAWHMRRAMRAFHNEAKRLNYTVKIMAAPMGTGREDLGLLRAWIPSTTGYQRVHEALHELLGLAAGA